ncbi:hypothetical protein [Sphingomonas sp.]
MEDTQRTSDRLAWVEPEISTLAIEETAAFSGVGPDGGVQGPDCTSS